MIFVGGIFNEYLKVKYWLAFRLTYNIVLGLMARYYVEKFEKIYKDV